jgi:uncharacterized protein GlcG (DUF336 family)
MPHDNESKRPHHGILLQEAETIIEAARAKGRALGLPPLTVAMLDNAGRLAALKREDSSSLLRPEIAQGKAFGALALGMGSRALAERAQKHPAFVHSVTALAAGALVPVPGGVLAYDADGLLLGAVGISGALPDEDEACAVAGIEAAGLIAETRSRAH